MIKLKVTIVEIGTIDHHHCGNPSLKDLQCVECTCVIVVI